MSLSALNSIFVFAVAAFEELEKKYPEIMNSLNFAQMMAESCRKKAETEKTILSAPPKVFKLTHIVRVLTPLD